VAAPGNHGYRHHVTDPGLRAITVCANVTDQAGAPVWQPLAMAEVEGSATAVTGVLGVEAFTSVPPAERCGHQAIDPVAALHALHKGYRGTAGSWIVLSHSGFSHDLLLARACPFIDVIFAGHCHSPEQGPQAVGGAVVVKGAELAVGYSVAWPDGARWHAETGEFSDDTERTPGGLPADLDQALAQVTKMRAVELSQAAQRVAPRDGSACIQATAQEGRAWARLGDATRTRAALTRVEALVSPLPMPDQPEHHYRYDPAKSEAYVVTTLSWLGDPAAERYARHVLARLESAADGPPRPRRAVLARVDLSLALVAASRHDEAAGITLDAITSGRLVPSNYWRAHEIVQAVLARGLPEAYELAEAYRSECRDDTLTPS
jgi:hypothetical protein